MSDSEDAHETTDETAEGSSISSSLHQQQSTSSPDISEQVKASMNLVVPFLCELLVEHKAVLSRVLVGADGRILVSDGSASYEMLLSLFYVLLPCPYIYVYQIVCSCHEIG